MFERVEPVIGPYENRPAECRDYDPRAAVVAREVIGLISAHLPAARAEHVGSTAVPGCAVKGIARSFQQLLLSFFRPFHPIRNHVHNGRCSTNQAVASACEEKP
jgi:hypothetical protein